VADYRIKASNIVLIAALLIGLAGLLTGCSGGQREKGGSPAGAESSGRSAAGEPALSAFVSILPQAYFVERIGSGRVQVEVLVKPGQEPHTFEPTPQQLARLAEAEVFFRIGVEFENSLMPRIESTMKELEVVDCREGIHLRQMEDHAHDRDEGEHDGDEEHQGSDPHIWLSVRNAVGIAETIRQALVRLDAGGAEVYDRGYQELVGDLEALEHRIGRILAPVKGRTFFVFHPSFGYFAEDYGLEQMTVETGGTEPSARQLARLIEEAKAREVRVIFVQPQFSQKSAQTVASEIEGAVVPIDPLARDYLENLENMARAVEEGLR
jgi:zinc transport system substrate-binding protein